MKYVKGLDTLRAFAVIFVLLGHWGLPVKLGPISQKLFTGLIPNAPFGVNLFFVLSGFLITNILLNAGDTNENRFVTMRNFIVRRTLRIFPIYYLAIFTLALIGDQFIREHLVWFLTYTSNILCFKQNHWNSFSHTWSLSVEEQFYLMWPWLMIFVSPRYLKYVFYGSIIIGIAATFYFIKIMQPTNNYSLLLLPSCVQAFGIGGLYAYARRDENLKKSFLKALNMLFPIALLVHFYWTFSTAGGHFAYWFRTVDSIISVWIIHKVMVMKNGWTKTKLFENSILVKIGQISYGIYLYHYAIPNLYQRMIDKLGVNTTAREILSNHMVAYFTQLTILTIICLASYHYIEKPILRLKRFFEYRKHKQLPAETTGMPVPATQPVLNVRIISAAPEPEEVK